jgi:Heterokaryon incompatibility protein (HET)
MPSRLLDVQHPNGVGLVSFSDGKKCKAKYVTLSHSWGHARILTLTHETASQLYDGLDESTLALSFRDAINMTRKLGIQYLWIDSLCIYQDDFSDWQSEASHMADVYSGSYCNLAATAASDSSKGFFAKSEDYCATRRLAEARCIRASWTSKDNLDLIHPDEYHIGIQDFWLEGMTNQPLLERGWVVQERMLAPRTIHFSHPQVFWECHHRIACETYPNRLPADAGVLNDLSMLWKQAHHKPPQTPSRYHRSDRPPIISGLSYFLDDQAVDQWQALVETFSKCKLTMECDKLPAMSGIAKQIAREGLRGRYLGGLWEQDFERQLLWFILFNTDQIKRPAQHRAPSWSWASLDGQISHFTMPRGDLVDMTVISVDTWTKNIEEGLPEMRINPRWYAKIRAPLHAAIVTKSNDDALQAQYWIRILGTALNLTSMIFWDTASPPKEARTWILPIWYHTWDKDLPVSRGLVLNSVPDSEPGTYERLGMFALDLDSSGQLETLIYGKGEIEQQEFQEYVCQKTRSGREQHLYTFTIV